MKARQNPMAFDTQKQELAYYYKWAEGAEQQIKELEEEMEEFGRRAFYKGREIEKYTEHGEAIFKRPTYNGYLRELNKH